MTWVSSSSSIISGGSISYDRSRSSLLFPNRFINNYIHPTKTLTLKVKGVKRLRFRVRGVGRFAHVLIAWVTPRWRQTVSWQEKPWEYGTKWLNVLVKSFHRWFRRSSGGGGGSSGRRCFRLKFTVMCSCVKNVATAASRQNVHKPKFQRRHGRTHQHKQLFSTTNASPDDHTNQGPVNISNSVYIRISILSRLHVFGMNYICMYVWCRYVCSDSVVCKILFFLGSLD